MATDGDRHLLKGDRVLLRGIEREDLERLWEISNDLELHMLVFDTPPTPQSYARLEAEFDTAAEEGGRDGASFAIELEGDLIGRCDLFEFDQTARTCRLAITIDRDHWNSGYGTEAVSLLLEHAFRHHNMNKVWLDVLADNGRAIRAYERAGFVEEGRLRQQAWMDGSFKDSLVMGALRSEWEKSSR